MRSGRASSRMAPRRSGRSPRREAYSGHGYRRGRSIDRSKPSRGFKRSPDIRNYDSDRKSDFHRSRHSESRYTSRQSRSVVQNSRSMDTTSYNSSRQRRKRRSADKDRNLPPRIETVEIVLPSSTVAQVEKMYEATGTVVLHNGLARLPDSDQQGKVTLQFQGPTVKAAEQALERYKQLVCMAQERAGRPTKFAFEWSLDSAIEHMKTAFHGTFVMKETRCRDKFVLNNEL